MGLLGSNLDFLIGFMGNLATFALLAYILIQVLIQFEIIPRHNQPARMVWGQLHRIFNPLLTPLRKVLPVLGGFDLSPLALLLCIYAVQYVLITLL